MKPILAALIAATLLTMPPARAQNAPASAAQPPDFPGLGEIMTLQQLRHIKLWFAGRADNWPLADYEVGELREGFEDADKLVGGGTVDKMVGAPMMALQKTVGDKDRAAFLAAFDRLNAGCNSCHQLLGRPFIAIQRPTSLPYSDQSFTPQK